jgi:flagellar basal-body rod protein FlgG
MLEGLHSAAAGMAAQQDRISAVSNDLANASTTGYKHVRVGFRDLMYQQAGRPARLGTNARTGTGSAAVDAGRSMGQGALQQTGNPLDVAIQGEGFLRVRLPDGRQALTRDGALRIDGTGRLTNSVGALVQPPIRVPAGTASEDVKIGRDGTVTGKAGARLGRLDLVSVRSPQGLQSVGDNAYVASAASGTPTRAPRATTLAAGAIEASNVDMSDAMIEMIDAQRSYQLASKAIETANQMMEIANGVKR